MLLDILRGEREPLQIVISLFTAVFVVFCTMPLHEYAHAWVATKLGDQTARLSGRLTIRPMAHIDPIGAVMILLVGFGYAKPVPVNPRNFKDSKKGMALTALAGPAANLIMAFAFMLVKNLIVLVTSFFTLSRLFVIVFSAISTFFTLAAIINIQLGVFNLLPIPPLDGSRILQLLIPDKYYYKMLRYERYVIIAVFVLLWIGVLDKPLVWLAGKVYDLFAMVTGLPLLLVS